MLLTALGVEDTAFLDIQQQYFEDLLSMCCKPDVALGFLLTKDEVLYPPMCDIHAVTIPSEYT